MPRAGSAGNLGYMGGREGGREGGTEGEREGGRHRREMSELSEGSESGLLSPAVLAAALTGRPSGGLRRGGGGGGGREGGMMPRSSSTGYLLGLGFVDDEGHDPLTISQAGRGREEEEGGGRRGRG